MYDIGLCDVQYAVKSAETIISYVCHLMYIYSYSESPLPQPYPAALVH